MGVKQQNLLKRFMQVEVDVKCIQTSGRKQNYKNPAVLSAFMIIHASFVHVSDVAHAYHTV